ncbi:hypothetical protein GCM10009850_083740 [Nonomuraea monospora]|uniref:STAS domain-containing protein n=1 Tax=Nonomuraea monospora TaxID=568818 RepID=A0ABN3CUE1_9ACTN
MLISVSDERDAANADELESYIGRMRRPVVLELGGLTFMDSIDLHVLLRVHGDGRRRGGSLRLAAVRDVPRAGAGNVLDLHNSAEAAGIATLSPPAHRRRRPR